MADYCEITLINLKMFSTELSDISVTVPHCSIVTLYGTIHECK